MNRLWFRQIVAVARMEVVKNLFTLRALPVYLLVAAPLFVILLILTVHGFYPDEIRELKTATGTAMMFAQLYQFILRFVIYGGCVWIFMNLFRGEILDRSLHYYFLAPIRRDVLAVGKFVSGWAAATILFVGTTAVSMLMLYSALGFTDGVMHLLAGPGLGQFLSYASVSMLACVGYGAVFLVVGLFFRNPIIPAMLIWVWELANPYLPVLLKKVSVIFYLRSMLPVTIDGGPFAVVAEPVSTWLAVPGLLIFAGLTLVAAGLRIRKLEVAYAD
jgi:ABC-type transport system involved in multi-copper enzyme maturation permease subunit